MRCCINVVLLPLVCILVFCVSYCYEDILMVLLDRKSISFFLLGL